MKTATKLFTVAAAMSAAASAHAVLVDVTINGIVENNQVTFGELGNVEPNDPVTITFQVDSDVFQNGAFPTRGYVIIEDSFSLTLGSATLGLQDPFPAGQTPYFSIRNNDPGVDGFLLTTDPDFPVGVPTDETGQLGQFVCYQTVTYGGGTLPSLDIVDAVGFYDFTGLSVYGFSIDDGPFNPVIIEYQDLTIELAETPCADTNDDNVVNVDDLVNVIQDWGFCAGCATDLNGDNRTNVDDLVLVITGWGPCPE